MQVGGREVAAKAYVLSGGGKSPKIHLATG